LKGQFERLFDQGAFVLMGSAFDRALVVIAQKIRTARLPMAYVMVSKC
jgi:hypothetical protein